VNGRTSLVSAILSKENRAASGIIWFPALAQLSQTKLCQLPVLRLHGAAKLLVTSFRQSVIPAGHFESRYRPERVFARVAQW
jgi:hypothetical protein